MIFQIKIMVSQFEKSEYSSAVHMTITETRSLVLMSLTPTTTQIHQGVAVARIRFP